MRTGIDADRLWGRNTTQTKAFCKIFNNPFVLQRKIVMKFNNDGIRRGLKRKLIDKRKKRKEKLSVHF